MSNTVTTPPQDLQDKYERYRNIQRQKVNDRNRLTKLISSTAVLCAVALLGIAATTHGSAQRTLVTGSVGLVAVSAGAHVMRRVNNRRIRKELLRVRQAFFMDE